MAAGHTFAGMRTVRILIAVATLLALASCGNAKPQAAETTTTAAIVATTTTTAATTTTTTAIPTTITPPATTIAPTTTAAAIDQTSAVKQAVLDYETVRLACLADPPTCDPATFSAGAQLEAERGFLETAIGRKAYARPRVEDPSYWVFESIDIASDGRSAILRGCHWSTAILESPGPVIINDDNVSHHDTVSLAHDGTRWLTTRVDSGRYLVGVNDCGPRP
jgi:ABC-type transport system substrate-binding protein